MGNYYVINARLIETATGSVLVSEKIKIKKEVLTPAVRKFFPAKYRIGGSVKFIVRDEQVLSISLLYKRIILKDLWLKIEPSYFLVLYYNNFHKISDNIELYTGISYKNVALFCSVRKDFKLHRNISSFLEIGSGIIKLKNKLEIFDVREYMRELISKTSRDRIRPAAYISTGIILYKDFNVSLKIEAGYFHLRNREEYGGYEHNLDLTGPLLGASLLMYF